MNISRRIKAIAVLLLCSAFPASAAEVGKKPQELLRTFIKFGGRVVICPMCMQNVGGMRKEDLISGVTMGGPDVTWPALFDDNVTVLSY